jgi:hypothetical protein
MLQIYETLIYGFLRVYSYEFLKFLNLFSE